MEQIMMNIFENLLEALMILVASGVLYVIKKYLGKFNFDEKKELVDIGVRFVEQFYKDFGGAQKYSEAVTWITDELNKRGLKYTDDELKALIESRLISMKNEIKKQW